MIATNSKSELPLVVLVTDDAARFGGMQEQMQDQCVFHVCDNQVVVLRMARDELVSGWLLDGSSSLSRSIALQLAASRLGHRMVLVHEAYEPQSELSAYMAGAYYVCGDVTTEWLQEFLGLDTAGSASNRCDAEVLSR